jgi:hypothetical protein
LRSGSCIMDSLSVDILTVCFVACIFLDLLVWSPKSLMPD